ncbi:MAG: carbohydrate binding family 9 domain-containing protein [Candidatus Fermentibacteraceae bacterium]|nr:carbohydrate binding family 9 domain-containing protein [Candidatus Fermentibacteraceae bacterium]MBN2609449.1 carbohydrate binding family 9 domain-containing protein [Candidatus Fermentibacteraceae bacterium]
MFTFFLLLASVLSTPQPINAVRIENGPRIDGLLDDQAWESADVNHSFFMQFSPDYGQEMTEPTDIYVLYDDRKVYFGFFLADPDHDSMVEALTPRDDYITGEWIAIILDTWGDGREATSFEVSLANSQMDSKLNPQGGWDYSWDAVWESGTAKVDGGWSAEFAIPLSCLRFNSNCDEQTWAVNFQRILSRTSENGWYVLSESGPMADLENFAPLTGIRNVEGSLGAEIRPYGAGRSYHYQLDDEWDHDYDAGVDVKVGLGSGLAADFTLNPDFGQVEADEAEMNLSHFELFRQEKRPFFLESQNIFRMPFNMFYSRRIGAVAPNGEVIPIIGGAKVSGSLGGGYRIGFLDAVTASQSNGDEILVPARNYGVLRTVREFGTYSYLGLSAVSRETWDQDSLQSGYNRAAALDGAFEIPGDHLVEFAVAESWNKDTESDGAYRLSLNRLRSMVGYAVGGEYVGDSFDVNGTGFTTVTGYWEGWASFWHNMRPELTFREVGYDLGLHYLKQDGGEVMDRSAYLEGNATLKNGINFGAEVHYNGEVFDPYEGPEGRTYGDHSDVFLRIGSNYYDPVYVWGGFGVGQWESGGDFQNYIARVTLHPTSALELGLEGNLFRTEEGTNYNWDIGDWDTRDTDWRSVVFRTNYIFSPDLHLRLFSQYSRFVTDFSQSPESRFGEIRANMLFCWQYMPGSMVYFLVENLFTEDGNGDFGSADVGLYAKVTWYLPI